MRARPLAGKAINTWSLKNNRKNEWRNAITYRRRFTEMEHSPVRIPRLGRKHVKSAQKGAACLAFSYIARATFLSHSLATECISWAHMCATLLAPKVYCQLVSPFPPARPPIPSRSARLLPRPHGSFYRPSNRRYTNSKFVHSIPLLVFCPLLSFSLFRSSPAGLFTSQSCWNNTPAR